MTKQAIPLEAFPILMMTVFIATIIVVAYIANFWIPFKLKRDYLKMEIRRSSGEERKYWERELKIFYASHFPFVRRFIIIKEKKSKAKEKTKG